MSSNVPTPLMPSGTFLKHVVTGINDLSPSCLIGLIGAGIQQSRAPGMQMKEGLLLGFRYFLLDEFSQAPWRNVGLQRQTQQHFEQ